MRSEKNLFGDLKKCNNFGKSKSNKIVSLQSVVPNVVSVVPNVVPKMIKAQNKKKEKKKEKKKNKGQYSNKHNFGETNVDEKTVNKVVERIEQLPPKKQNFFKKYFIKMLVAIGYKLGDLLDFTLKEIISLVIKHFGKIALAIIMIHYGRTITNSINNSILNVGTKFNIKRNTT